MWRGGYGWKSLTSAWYVHRGHKTQTSQTSKTVWLLCLRFSFAELIHLWLECKQMNCAVAFPAAVHFIDGCRQLALSQSMPDLTSHRLKFQVWNMIDKCVAGYILSIRAEGLCQWECEKSARDKESCCEIMKNLKNASPQQLKWDISWHFTICNAASQCAAWIHSAVITGWHWHKVETLKNKTSLCHCATLQMAGIFQ